MALRVWRGEYFIDKPPIAILEISSNDRTVPMRKLLEVSDNTVPNFS